MHIPALLLRLYAASLLGVCSAIHAQQSCDPVLSNGVFRTESIKNNAYVRQQLAARLTTMTKQQAESKVGAGLTLPIDGIPLGANYSDEEFKSWQQSVRSSLDIDNLLQHETETMSSVGDATIVNAWVECLKINAGGLRVAMIPQGDTVVLLTITWIPGLGAPEFVTLRESVKPQGAIVLSGASLVQQGSQLRRLNATQIQLARPKNEAVAVVVNTSVVGGHAYLPRLVDLPLAPATDRLVKALMDGRQCSVSFPNTPEDDYLGTIARGPAYSLSYNRSTGLYSTTGYVALRGGNNTAIYAGPSPDEHRFVIWGAPFSFSATGAVTSESNTNANRKLTGTIICP